MHTLAITNCTAIAPNFPAAACRRLLRSISELREKLRDRYAPSQPHDAELVRVNLAEAEALAWETSFPHLFLPLLAEEKVRLAFARRSAAPRPRAQRSSSRRTSSFSY